MTLNKLHSTSQWLTMLGTQKSFPKGSEVCSEIGKKNFNWVQFGYQHEITLEYFVKEHLKRYHNFWTFFKLCVFTKCTELSL